MAGGGKDPYTVRRSGVDPTKWAVYKNGTETQFRYADKSSADGKALRMNVRAHGGS